MQIHELNSFSGTPSASDYLVTDNGTDTSKIPATELIAPAVDAVADEVATRQSADALLQSQIDQLVAPTGTAPNPAEIENARIGADNVTYTTLGSAIRTQVSDLKADFNSIFAETTKFVEYNLTSIADAYAGYNVSTNGTGVFLGAASFDSYAFFAEEDTQVWVDPTTGGTYYALCVGINPQTSDFVWTDNVGAIACESAIRYRNYDNNLPTEESPLSIASGSLIVVACKPNENPTINIKKTEKSLLIDKVSALRASSTKITIKGSSYEVDFEKLSTTQGFEWNITSLKGKSATNIIPSGTDIIGVLQFKDASNFMGGLHGNESCYEFDIFSKGNSVLNEDGYYDELTLVMNSHLYDVDDPTQNVVDRYVEMIFKPSGWTCRVTFKVLVNAIIQNAYCSGLFGFYKASASGCYTNVGTLDLTETNRQFENANFKEVVINLTDNMTINMTSETSDDGWVDYRSANTSYKIYFRNWHLQTVTANSYLTGKCEYRFS